ncbi:MAG: bioF [Candidatus Midichloriaceae bacterium]|nr:bioF [Candidatus Midichloriaceae bacterium]
MYSKYIQHLSRLHNTDKIRKLPEASCRVDKVDFSTNDYLCLSHNPEVLSAAIEAGKKYGVGATGSRLLSGNNNLFQELEEVIARDKGLESALIFNSGFQANFSVLSSLLDSKVLGEVPIVFFDKLNHASLYQAVLLSGAELIRYRHNNMQHLSALMEDYANDNRPKFIVTETIFGMDGDVLNIKEIASLAKKHNAFLYLDEAHATGIVGNNGYGLSTTISLKEMPHLVMGTFSKALGASGGYIACDSPVRDYILNKAPGFIYSTANSPILLGAISKAWSMIKGFGAERERLNVLAYSLNSTLKELGFNTGNSTSHIIPIILHRETKALDMRNKLLDNGIIVSCIRPPTVPPKTSRIRMALNIHHTSEDIEKLTNVLKTL